MVLISDGAGLGTCERIVIGVRALPRYVYECTKCEHTYEKREGWDAKPKQRCPKCRAVSIRIPAPPAIVFKGSGWYSTDNRRTLREGADQLNSGNDDGESSSDGPSDRDSDAGSGESEKKKPAKAKAESDSDG